MEIIWFLCGLPYDGWVGCDFTHVGEGGELLVVGSVCDDVCPCACDLREEVWWGFVFFGGGGGGGGGHVDVCLGESFYVGKWGRREEEGSSRGGEGEGGGGREEAQQHEEERERKRRRGHSEGRGRHGLYVCVKK